MDRSLRGDGEDMNGRHLRIELHSHTTYSFDGFIEFDCMVKTALRRRIDVIAITDHDNFDGAKEFSERAEKGLCPIQIIAGEERTLARRATDASERVRIERTGRIGEMNGLHPETVKVVVADPLDSTGKAEEGRASKASLSSATGGAGSGMFARARS